MYKQTKLPENSKKALTKTYMCAGRCEHKPIKSINKQWISTDIKSVINRTQYAVLNLQGNLKHNDSCRLGK